MRIFLVYIRDEDYYQYLPEELGGSKALLFFLRIFLRPIQTYKLIRDFGRYMKASDIIKLLSSPFHRRILAHHPALPAKMNNISMKATDRQPAPVH